MPVVLALTRASKLQALQAAMDDEARDAALHALKRDMAASSYRTSRESKVRLCEEFHNTWFSGYPPWLPITFGSVLARGAMLKAGGYSSGANYISAARVNSRDRGHEEPALLGHTVKRAVASIERGVGQAKQTQSLPLARFGEPLRGDEASVRPTP